MLSIFKRKKYKDLIKYHDELVINIDTSESEDKKCDEGKEISNSSFKNMLA